MGAKAGPVRRGPTETLLRKWRWTLLVSGTVWALAVLLPRWIPDPEILLYAPTAKLLAIGFFIVQTAVIFVADGLLARRAGIRSPRLLRDMAALFLHMIVAAIILKITLGLEVGPLLATSAVIGAVVGLALQETLGTLFAGLMLARERRIVPGVWIEVEELFGEVEELSWRSVLVRTPGGHRVLIPNSSIASSQVKIFADGQAPSTVSARLILPREAEPASVKQVLQGVAMDLPGIEKEPPPKVLVREVAGEYEGTIYEGFFWTHTPGIRATIADQFITRGMTALRRELGLFTKPDEQDHRAQLVESLRSAMIFQSLPPVALQELAGACCLLRYAAGEAIVRQGESSRALYVVAAGEAVAAMDGMERSHIGEGEIFGEIGFLTGEARTATVRAAKLTDVVRVDSAALSALLTGREELAEELASRIAQYRARDAQRVPTEESGDEPVSWTEFLRNRILQIIGRRGPRSGTDLLRT